jgi:hypothetical protein
MSCTDRRYWRTGEVREFRLLYPNMTNAALSAQFGRSWSAIKNMATKLALRKSAAFVAAHCRWTCGLAPWNKGKRGWQAGGRAHQTKFKKGQRGARQRPVGSERLERDSVMVKVAEPSVWKPKARVVWEQHFGPIPRGAIIRMRDGNPENCAPRNLRLITRGEHVRLNWKPRGPARKPLTWTAPLRMAA